jgi:hypothetical protein
MAEEEVIRENIPERPRAQPMPRMVFGGGIPQMLSGLQVFGAPQSAQVNMMFPDVPAVDMIKLHPLGFNAAVICRLCKMPMYAETLQFLDDKLNELANSSNHNDIFREIPITSEQEYKFRYVDCAFNVKLKNFDWQYWQMIAKDFIAWFKEIQDRNTPAPILETLQMLGETPLSNKK